ncbi:MAG: hypothetical protein IRY89_12755 [Pseudolabrys sp.]|nr:hypothetical protein [Pseudolabrys sp.]
MPTAAADRLGGGRARSPRAAASGLAFWLSLAAAPSFAVMALCSALSGRPADMLCTAMQGSSPMLGMTAMYLLMCAFHAPPWLRLFAGKA